MTKKIMNIDNFKSCDKDTGSTSIQIIFLTERINSINEHLKINPKDKHGKRGLMVLVGKRSRLSKYLKRKNGEEYLKVLELTGLRK